jgi:hypothetical protein
MKMSRNAWVALGAAGVVGVGALTVPVVAQDSREVGDDRPSIEELRSNLANRLAEELDLPVDQVEEALAAVHEDLMNEWQERATDRLRERLSDAVEDGDLTQEQADAILEAVENGVLFGPLDGGRFGPLPGPLDARHFGPFHGFRDGPFDER